MAKRRKTKHPNIYPLPPEAPELPGWPGYRTRPGRSGLDPLDSGREAAFMEGTFVRRLVTGQLRTRNPIYVGAMLLAGLGLLLPLVAVIGETLTLRGPAGNWILAVVLAVLGVLLL